MLNTLDMYGICHEIYRDFSGEFVYSEIDETILNFIFRLYNVTEIDCEEIISLWIEWLKNGRAKQKQKWYKRLASACGLL